MELRGIVTFVCFNPHTPDVPVAHIASLRMVMSGQMFKIKLLSIID